MGDKEREMNFKSFWGTNLLRSRVEFSRNGHHYCVYCGEKSDTREHCPSKVFLSKPYPDDLPVLPACFKCNNSFSADEMYTEIYIDALKFFSGNSNILSDKTKKHIENNTAFSDAQADWAIFRETGVMKKREKIYRILTKLSICHMVYDLSEGYSVDGCSIKPSQIEYKTDIEMSNHEKEEFNDIIFMSDKVLPSLGSRVFDRIFVLSPVLAEIIGEETIESPMAIMDWNDVQDENYRYIAWLENDDTFHIKIVIHNFLYVEAIFPQGDLQ